MKPAKTLLRKIPAGPLLAAFLVTAQASHAASTEGQYAMRGLGSAQCSALTTALAGETAPALREALGSWITGYISGRNEVQPDTFDAVPLQDTRILTALVAAACQANPDALVQVTLSAIVQKLDAARVRSPAPMIPIGDPPMQIHAEVLAFVQTRLAALGLMAAPAALGAYDAPTRSAIAAFQTSAGIAASGLPDDATVLMLMGKD